MKKKLISGILLCYLYAQAFAQSGTNSPYSQYGLGVLSDQSQGFNRGMNGLALGLRYGNQVNSLNPASYSVLDSLTMIFDVGFSGQITHFTEGNVKRNANNADFEYAVGAFRVTKGLGLSIGILPYSNIGYDYSTSTSRIGSSETTYAETHSGDGGIHQAYLGFGWNVFGGLSIGANVAYLWGTYEKTISLSYSDTYVNTVSKSYTATVRSYKVDFGLQWHQQLSKTDWLTIGLTYGLGHKLNSDPQLTTSQYSSVTSESSEATLTIDNGLSIPHTFGAGLSWNHARKLTVGVDYSLQKWGELDYPEYDTQTDKYLLRSGLLCDRQKFTIGGEWVSNEMSRNFFARIRYRAGASFATPYYRINGQDGPKEYSVSAGVGVPIVNTHNNRSLLNVSLQWVRTDAASLVKEDMFRINIGITFNERWFMKWKVE